MYAMWNGVFDWRSQTMENPFRKSHGKTQSKEPPKWMDTLQNYIFVCLKDHKGSIVVWIIIIKKYIFSINYKIYMLKAWYK